jgi:hypothetical protein
MLHIHRNSPSSQTPKKKALGGAKAAKAVAMGETVQLPRLSPPHLRRRQQFVEIEQEKNERNEQQY